MTSSPESGFTAGLPGIRAARAATSRAATPTAPVPAFQAAPGAATRTSTGEAREFDALRLPSSGAEAEETTRIRESARTSGFAEGWAQGMRAAAAQAAADHEAAQAAVRSAAEDHEVRRAAALRRATAAVQAAADALRAERDPTVAQLADTVLELACDLAGAVLDREVSLLSSPVLEAVQRALRPLDATQPVTVRVHPDDLVVLLGDGPVGEALKESGLDADAGLVSYVGDRTMQPGDAVARQGNTEVDASLRASVSRALEALTGAEVHGQAQ
ncbi:hypothetical protein NUM3379_01060 [Kineococcus sp. NUM-3379]